MKLPESPQIQSVKELLEQVQRLTPSTQQRILDAMRGAVMSTVLFDLGAGQDSAKGRPA